MESKKKIIALGVFLSIILLSLFSLNAFVSAQGNETNQSNATNESLPYIDPAIHKAFENQTWVEIIVKYKGEINITSENEEEMFNYYMQNRTETTRFFDYIPETQMKIKTTRLSARQPSFVADINKQGLEKLVNNSRVTKIYLDIQTYNLKNESTYENKTQTEETNEKEIRINKFLLSIIITVIVLVIIAYVIIKKRR